jgi:hypothetical protein
MATTNRVMEVYQTLGRVLSNPVIFGLGPTMPRSLEFALVSARRKLIEVLNERSTWPDDEGVSLETELSQDADTAILTGTA